MKRRAKRGCPVGGIHSRRAPVNLRPVIALGPLCLAACALDRVDGSLILELLGVPSEATLLEMNVRSEEREFGATISRPKDDVVREFSAIPAGSALVSVTALTDGEAVAASDQTPIVVPAWSELSVRLELHSLSALRIVDPPDGTQAHIGDGPIPIVITALDPGRKGTLVVEANGRPVGMTENSTGWIGQVDPRFVGPRLPALLELTARLTQGGRTTRSSRRVEVHRRAFALRVHALPRVAVSAGVVWVGDSSGEVFQLETSSGDAHGRWSLGGGVIALTAVGSGAMALTEGGDLVFVDSSSDPRILDLRAEGSTSLSSISKRVAVGVGRQLITFEAPDGIAETIATFGSTLRAPALVDEHGLAAADLSGAVMGFDSSGARVIATSLNEAVVAKPFRSGSGELIVSGAITGVVKGLTASSAVEYGVFGAPVVFPPCELGNELVFAAGDQLRYVSGRAVSVGAPITAPPRRLRDRVVVGTSDGRTLLVGSTVELVSVLPSAVTDLVAFEESGRFLAVGVRGDLEMLEPEVFR
ncbi:MAG: hypothetical protein HY791_33310 [Deltaproteobacteria bacterium]|nr:hypothetical protein [Deltaproteobacteria bacterium]